MDRAIVADTAVLEGMPPDVTAGLHICRGNYRSSWMCEGSLESVAERIFGELPYDAFLVEWDDIGRDGALMVMGIVSTKTPALESEEALLARMQRGGRAGGRAGAPRDLPAVWVRERHGWQRDRGRRAMAEARAGEQRGGPALGALGVNSLAPALSRSEGSRTGRGVQVLRAFGVRQAAGEAGASDLHQVGGRERVHPQRPV